METNQPDLAGFERAANSAYERGLLIPKTGNYLTDENGICRYGADVQLCGCAVGAAFIYLHKNPARLVVQKVLDTFALNGHHLAGILSGFDGRARREFGNEEYTAGFEVGTRIRQRWVKE